MSTAEGDLAVLQTALLIINPLTFSDKPLPAWELGLIIGSCALLFVFLVIGLCLRHFYGPQMWLFCSSRLDLCGPKTIVGKCVIGFKLS